MRTPHTVQRCGTHDTRHDCMHNAGSIVVLWRKEDQKCGENKVLAIVKDSAAYMLKAAESLCVFYPKIIHLTCLGHGVHRVAEEVRTTLPEANSLISSAKKVFIEAPNRVRASKTALPDCPLLPEPVLMRWGTWISAANYFADNHRKVEEALKGFEDSENLAIRKAKDALKNSSMLHSLSSI
ncbi:uncharacterized protein LOC126191238 [Schistocerca cancellata]|uniref:uncharacterized protein LOC126191238 n=1 Tax=Schistocerca cancellata TaxID=274614 RepID=UPI0021173D0D|nr:uncharacterized protein LOC126191238 [Schistocerca cancellata]XP_049788001.1 uncharacterized protein LOC126191238 [Schistocerca cancellata]